MGEKLSIVFLSISGDITRYPISHGNGCNIGKLLYHPLVVLEIISKFIVVFFNQFNSNTFYVGRPDFSHVSLTISAAANGDWLF
jgi:hypothetical protein